MANKTVGVTIIALLALAQGGMGILRASQLFELGSDLLGQGLLLLPLIGYLAFFRGALVAAIALLYVLFAWGVFLARAWARWLGIGVAAATLFLVVSVMIQGESWARAVPWSIVPLIMMGYLSSSPGRDAFKVWARS